MLYKTVDEFTQRAELIYRSNSEYKKALDRPRQVIRNEHEIQIPPGMLPRAREYKSGIGREKLDRAITTLVDGRGPLLTVYSDSVGRNSIADRERVQEWIMGGIHEAATRCDRHIYAATAEDVLAESKAFWRILPDQDYYNGIPSMEDRVPDDLDVDDEKAVARYKREKKREVEGAKRRRFPISAEWVPAEAIQFLTDRHGIKDLWEYQTKTVLEVLDEYKDDKGRTLAKQLKESVENKIADLHYNSVVTIAIHTDRTHMQIGLLGFEIEEDWNRADYQYESQVVELLWSGKHGLDEVPYAYFPGRQTTSRRPEHRWNPFINNIVAELIVNYDYLMTQLLSIARMVAWPTMVLERPPDGPGSTDKPPSVDLVEGQVWNGLPPGAKITSPGMTNATDMRFLPDAATAVRSQIDLHTLTAAAYGTNAANSGYLQNQLVEATESTLEASAWGIAQGYENVARLELKCGKYLIQECGTGSIPVRYTNEEGMKFVSLDERLAKMEWEVVAEIRQKPPGGEAALSSTLAQQKGQGWISDAYAMQRLGIRNIERMRRQILEERATFSPELLKLVVEMTVERARRSFARQIQPKLPERPMLTPALANNITDEEILNRMPGGGLNRQPTNAGMPGAINPAPGTPTPGPQTIAANSAPFPTPGVTPGGRTGNAQRLPGGLIRTDQGTNGRGF